MAFSRARKHLPMAAVLATIAPACVSVLSSWEVVTEITAPCDAWEGHDGLLDMDLVRSEAPAASSCDAHLVECNGTTVASAQVRCGEVTQLSFFTGALPEVYGVRMRAPDGTRGWILLQADAAERLEAEIVPGMNPTDFTDEPQCEPLAQCFATPEEPLPACSEDPTPTPDAPTPNPTSTPAAPPTPTPTPSAPSVSSAPTPSSAPTAAPSPSASGTPTAATPTAATPTP